MIGIPPAWVVLGTSNEVVDEDPDISVDEPDDADAPGGPDVADGPGVLPVDPGAGLLPASDVMETVAFLDVTGADEVDSPGWDCEEGLIVVLGPGSEPP